jgi:ribonuclease-3
MVSSAALCSAVAETGFAGMLRLNRGAQVPPPKSKTIADALEAVIGAAYLDGGFEAARTIFENLRLAEKAAESGWSSNPKGELQVRTQALTPPRCPEYALVRVDGKAHKPLFTVKVQVEGVGEAVAQAGNRQEAESLAAAVLLKRIGRRDYEP